jgi:type VI secretion system protein ImpA
MDAADFEKLLAPIEGVLPVGPDLRTDSSPTSIYYAVKDARMAARASERQMMLEGHHSGPPLEWRPVLERGFEALAEKSKDLELAAYVVEALVRLQGFPGLRDGFCLLRELVERFWDQLYPLPDEDGIDTRVAPLAGLNGDGAEGTLMGPLVRVPLTAGANAGPYSYSDYQQAQALHGTSEEVRAKRIARGAITMEQFTQAVNETPPEFFDNLVQVLKDCQDEFEKLTAALDKACGDRSPPTSAIRSSLEQCLDTVRATAGHKLKSEAAPAEAPAAVETAPGMNGTVAARPPGEVQTREEAFAAITKIADFFRRTEPHSPMSYALDQVVRWGRLPLPQLLLELVPDRGPREYLGKLVGIPQEQS